MLCVTLQIIWRKSLHAIWRTGQVHCGQCANLLPCDDLTQYSFATLKPGKLRGCRFVAKSFVCAIQGGVSTKRRERTERFAGFRSQLPDAPSSRTYPLFDRLNLALTRRWCALPATNSVRMKLLRLLVKAAWERCIAHKTLFEKSVAQDASGWAKRNERGCAPLRFRSALE
jgi:hypothetical protein